jgi:hypothetical protein
MSIPFDPRKPVGQHAWTLPLDGLLLLMSAAAVWLGNRPVDAGASLFPVAGQVLCDGLPAHEAELVFHPLGQAGRRAYPGARTGPDGRFQAGTYFDRDGMPAGDYAVTVVWHPRVIDGEDYLPGPNVLPLAYARPESTPWRVRVEPKVNELPPLRIELCHCP